MKTYRIAVLVAAAVAAMAVSSRGNVILFDDVPQNGMAYFNATQSSEQVAAGSFSMKMDRGAYSEAGLIGNTGALPASDTILQYKFYLASGSVSGVTLIISGNTQKVYDNSASAWWTVDGSPGSSSLLTANAWHTVTFDLTFNPSYVAGTSGLVRVAPKPGGSGFVAYMDDVRTVPEPASLALLGAGVMAMFRRRRA